MDTEKTDLETVAGDSAASGCGFKAVKLLRWLELRGLALDHAKFSDRYRETDGGWWLADGERTTGPMPFNQVLELVVDGHGPAMVVHESEAGLDEPPWRRIEYSPIWLRPLPARLWTLGFWTTLALLGLGLVHFVVPYRFQFAGEIVYWIAVAGLVVWRWFAGRRAAKPSAGAVAEGTEPEGAEEV